MGYRHLVKQAVNSVYQISVYSCIGPPLTPQETLTLLTQAGLFDTAFTVASAFKLPRDMVFEGLAARLVFGFDLL